MKNSFFSPMEQRFVDLAIKLDRISTVINTLNVHFEDFSPKGLNPDESQKCLDASNMAFIASEYIGRARAELTELESAYLDERETTRIDVDTTILITSPAKKTQHNRCEQRMGV